MNYKIKSYSVILLLLVSLSALSQNKRIDSVQQLVKAYEVQHKQERATLKDSVKAKLLELLSDYTYDNQRENSLHYSREALALSSKIKYFKGVYTNSYNLGANYSFAGDYILSLKYLTTAMDAAKKLNSPSKMASVHSEKGIVYSRMSNYSEATKNALLALRYYEKSDNTYLHGNTLVNLGIVYKQQGKIDLALTQYEKALVVYQKLDAEDASYPLAATYGNIAQAHLKAGNTSKSLEALLKSQEYAKNLNDAYLNAENNSALGMIYFRLKEYRQSETYYQAALQDFISLNDKSGIAKTKVSLGRTYFKQNKTRQALQYNQEGLDLAKNTKHLEWQKEGYEDRSDMFLKQSKYKEAYENHVLFKQINDSMFNASEEKKITELQMQYTFDKAQEQAKNAQFQKILKLNNETSRLRFIKNSALLVAGVFLILSGFILYNFLKVKKQRKLIDLQQDELKLQNGLIHEALSEKEVLLKEIHHRVKNNLQIISSLLNIQAQNITDKNVLDSIKEGQSRVEVMSLIHQNLYQSKELDAIHIEEYIKQLTFYLNEMFNSATQKVVIDVVAPDLYFDIDTAIPLGLIVNELVSNAFKYAFLEKENRSIAISIEAIDDLNYQMQISDNGVGLPQHFKIGNSNSLGLKLVSILSRQLRGSVAYSSEKGTTFTITFKHLKTFNSLPK